MEKGVTRKCGASGHNLHHVGKELLQLNATILCYNNIKTACT